MNWTANTLTKAITGLNEETTDYFTVLGENDDDLVTADPSTSTSTLCNGKKIYLATVSWGSFGGKSDEDGICAAQKPAGFSGTAKALLFVSTGHIVCTGSADCSNNTTGRTDWSLAAITKYCNKNYVAPMGTSMASGYLNVTLANSLSSSSSGFAYTGMNSNCAPVSNANCQDWTAWANPNQGAYGRPNVTGTGFHSYGMTNMLCSSPGDIYCVEQ